MQDIRETIEGTMYFLRESVVNMQPIIVAVEDSDKLLYKIVSSYRGDMPINTLVHVRSIDDLMLPKEAQKTISFAVGRLLNFVDKVN